MGAPFPTEWEVRPTASLPVFGADQQDATDAPRRMRLLIPLDTTHRYNGDFRILISGGELISVRLPLLHIIPNLPVTLHPYFLEFTCDNDDVTPMRGSVTTPWMDIEELVRLKAANIKSPDNQLVDSGELLRFLHTMATDKELHGASVRWAVAVDATKRIQLQLQCLPTPAQYLNKAHLQQDGAASILLGEFPIEVPI